MASCWRGRHQRQTLSCLLSITVSCFLKGPAPARICHSVHQRRCVGLCKSILLCRSKCCFVTKIKLLLLKVSVLNVSLKASVWNVSRWCVMCHTSFHYISTSTVVTVITVVTAWKKYCRRVFLPRCVFLDTLSHWLSHCLNCHWRSRFSCYTTLQDNNYCMPPYHWTRAAWGGAALRRLCQIAKKLVRSAAILGIPGAWSFLATSGKIKSR